MQQLEKKIPVAVLGAAGTVGQRFVELLTDHPWFTLAALSGSERSAGERYADTCNWKGEASIPADAAEMVVQPLGNAYDAEIVFSALPSEVAKEIEPELAAAGYAVCSNASAFRDVPDVPLLIPEINSGHLALIDYQREKRGWKGFIVTSPNCAATGIALPLKPLDDAFGLEKTYIFTMQAISGAGYPGIPALDIVNNVFPYIGGEDEKVARETRLLLGNIGSEGKEPHPMAATAQVNRVNVIDGHTARLGIELRDKAEVEEVYAVMEAFNQSEANLGLPSSPEKILHLFRENGRPQPRLDSRRDKGMAISVGQVRPCDIFDFQMTTLVHNTMRGAAGGAILNAELLVAKGLVA
jgi:aspartate-semialdehyde dehydrogenase